MVKKKVMKFMKDQIIGVIGLITCFSFSVWASQGVLSYEYSPHDQLTSAAHSMTSQEGGRLMLMDVSRNLMASDIHISGIHTMDIPRGRFDPTISGLFPTQLWDTENSSAFVPFNFLPHWGNLTPLRIWGASGDYNQIFLNEKTPGSIEDEKDEGYDDTPKDTSGGSSKEADTELTGQDPGPLTPDKSLPDEQVFESLRERSIMISNGDPSDVDNFQDLMQRLFDEVRTDVDALLSEATVRTVVAGPTLLYSMDYLKLKQIIDSQWQEYGVIPYETVLQLLRTIADEKVYFHLFQSLSDVFNLSFGTEDVNTLSTSLQPLFIDREDISHIVQAWSQLTPQQRRSVALELHYYVGYTLLRESMQSNSIVGQLKGILNRLRNSRQSQIDSLLESQRPSYRNRIRRLGRRIEDKMNHDFIDTALAFRRDGRNESRLMVEKRFVMRNLLQPLDRSPDLNEATWDNFVKFIFLNYAEGYNEQALADNLELLLATPQEAWAIAPLLKKVSVMADRKFIRDLQSFVMTCMLHELVRATMDRQ